jgi:hypothetical protein
MCTIPRPICANACAMFYCNYNRDQLRVERAREASGKAVLYRPVPQTQQVVVQLEKFFQPVLQISFQLVLVRQ